MIVTLSPRIAITFSRTTPESAAEGDFSSTGWVDEEGVSMVVDSCDDRTSAELAVAYLKAEGASEPSSSAYHPGAWYTSYEGCIDYATGEEEQRGYHLKDFTPDEERAIFNAMKGR